MPRKKSKKKLRGGMKATQTKMSEPEQAQLKILLNNINMERYIKILLQNEFAILVIVIN